MSLFDLIPPNELLTIWEGLTVDENGEFPPEDEKYNGIPIHQSTGIPVPGSGGQHTPQIMQLEGRGSEHTPQGMQLEGNRGQHTPQSVPLEGSWGQHTPQNVQLEGNGGQHAPQSITLEDKGGQPFNFLYEDDDYMSHPPPVTEKPPEQLLSTAEQLRNTAATEGGAEQLRNTDATEGGAEQLRNTAATEGGRVASLGSLQQNLMTTQTQPVRVSPDEQSHVPMPDIGPQETQLTMMHQQQVAMPVSNAQSLNTFQNTGGTLFLTTMAPQQQTPLVIMPQQQTHLTPVSQKGGGVVDVPALTDMEGEYGFSVSIEEKERTTKSPMWLMSKITKKLYTNINKAVPFEIRLKKEVPREFHIRAVTVFSSAQFLRTNVTRCPNHASPADVTNHDFPYPAHVLRADHPKAEYENNSNGRLSVVVPLDILQDGSDYTPILLRFMCLGSCVGGINRRPIAIILTLENNAGQLFGRKVIDVRVCACPTRDIRTDEQTLMNKGVKRRGSSLQDKPQVVIRKKPKTTAVVEPKYEPPEDDRIFYIQVRGQKLYDFLNSVKEVYLKSHPEYEEKYPDDCRSFQIDDESDDELKGNPLQRLGSGDSETVNWDSGGDSPQRSMFNNDSHLDTLSGTKNNSPLSKLTPNISISPTPTKLRLWHEDTDNEVIGFSQGESLGNSLDYPSITKAQSTDVILTSSKSASNSINSESITSRSSVQSQFIKNMDFIPKHIPVMQVQSYKPGGSTLKTKLKYHTIQNQYGDDRSNKNERKNPRGNYSSLDPTEISYGQSAEEYLSPGSPEMLAANVLVEGFKAKTMTKQ